MQDEDDKTGMEAGPELPPAAAEAEGAEPAPEEAGSEEAGAEGRAGRTAASGKADLAGELREARREIALLNDRYLRTAAEMDNQRKRLDREKAEYLQFALSDLMKDLLAVLDNFERALAAGGEAGPEAFGEGIGLIHKQILDLLRKRGVTPIEAADDVFDPAFQQAIVTEESDAADERKVAVELQKGYRLHDRLLRPALVKVMVPKRS